MLEKTTLKEIICLMKNKTNMFSGNSGVGKSTLINTLFPELKLKTIEISNTHKQGKHATTFSEMHDLYDGIKIVDTPGVKSFGIVDINPKELSNYFPEFLALKGNCKFNNCMHLKEPNCAIKLGLEKTISQTRYDSYIDLIQKDTTIKLGNVRAKIQRVSNAKVSINGIEESIDRGLLLFLGIEVDDTKEDLKWLVNKIINLRIFNDSNGVMNISLLDSKGELLVVSQFTLIASIRKGNRPSYVRAAKHDIAIPLYES